MVREELKWQNIDADDLPAAVKKSAPPHSINSSALTIRRTGFTEYWIGTAASVWLDVGGADHLAPLLGLFRHELAELGGRHLQWDVAEVGEPSLHPRICEGSVHFLVEPFGDLRWNVSGGAEASCQARLEAWQDIANGREVRERLRALRRARSRGAWS
jgi:hypothetical protein